MVQMQQSSVDKQVHTGRLSTIRSGTCWLRCYLLVPLFCLTHAASAAWWETKLTEAIGFEAKDQIPDAAKAWRSVLNDESLPAKARAEAAAGVGWLAEREKHLKPAEEFYRQALDLNPSEARACLRLGYLLENNAEAPNVEEARRLYRSVVENHPTRAEGHFHLALRLALDAEESDGLSRELQSQAEDHLRIAITLNPTDAKPHMWLYMLLDQRGETAAAQEHLEAAKAIDPFAAEEFEDYESQKETDKEAAGSSDEF